MSTVVLCTDLARRLFSGGDPTMGVHVAIYDRSDEDGTPWLVCEAFSTRNGGSSPPVTQRIERREVRSRYERGKLVHTAAERQYESRDVAAAKLLSELYAVLHAELQGKTP